MMGAKRMDALNLVLAEAEFWHGRFLPQQATGCYQRLRQRLCYQPVVYLMRHRHKQTGYDFGTEARFPLPHHVPGQPLWPPAQCLKAEAGAAYGQANGLGRGFADLAQGLACRA